MSESVAFTVQRAGSRAIVLANGSQVGNWMSVPRARERADELAKKGTYRMRKCLCCPTTFLSEGTHHRMCNVCRHKGASAETVAV